MIDFLPVPLQTREHSDGEDPGGPIHISLQGIGIAAFPLLVIILASIQLGLQIQGKLTIAAFRCAGQLSVLGWVLVPIFTSGNPWLTFGYSLLMILVAASEAIARPTYTYNGIFFTALFGLGISSSAFIMFALVMVIGVVPFYDPQYMIPLLGMLLGNSCSSVSIGISSVLNEFHEGKEKIELLLALGASRMEATADVRRKSIQLAMTPLINTMNVVGIVNIPGMMTGQILGGSDPAVAARYQIVLFFFVALTSSTSTIITVFAATMHLCDGRHRLRLGTLYENSSRYPAFLLSIARKMKSLGREDKNMGRNMSSYLSESHRDLSGSRESSVVSVGSGIHPRGSQTSFKAWHTQHGGDENDEHTPRQPLLPR